MHKKYTLLQRIKSDTPVFFKRAQLFGLGLASLGTSLTQVAGIPAKLCTILISIGSTIALVSQFAVKQSEPLNIPIDEKTK
ncbi:hypothetical protein [Mucilaginibacter sp.]|jgi:hypothetical protein|uniref:hypothetical protein n=1 Tax=Mucilaginibacter sp. TaxID=1882438 RepID=UPI0035657747